MLKALFDESFLIPNPVTPGPDGSSLLPYTGPDAGRLTVGGELNKLAANVAIGRNFAGIHYRSDYTQSLKLGEMVAVSALRDRKLQRELRGIYLYDFRRCPNHPLRLRQSIFGSYNKFLLQFGLLVATVPSIQRGTYASSQSKEALKAEGDYQVCSCQKRKADESSERPGGQTGALHAAPAEGAAHGV
jgi:hypothetical protein